MQPHFNFDYQGIDSFISWVGGKRALRKDIILRFPIHIPRYIEVFGGGGWVLFYKQESFFEVFNDFNLHLVNLYRCVRDKAKMDEMLYNLTFVLNSRDDFEQNKKLIYTTLPTNEKGDVELATAYYCLIRYSYGASTTSFGCQPHNINNDIQRIEKAHLRLVKTIIENKDCVDLINHYDNVDSLFYLDPPYYDAESVYSHINGFVDADHVRLRDKLAGIKGKFILSYNDHPRIRELYSQDGFFIEEIVRIDNLKQRYEKGAVYKELIISNYDTSERMNKIPDQLSIFNL